MIFATCSEKFPKYTKNKQTNKTKTTNKPPKNKENDNKQAKKQNKRILLSLLPLSLLTLGVGRGERRCGVLKSVNSSEPRAVRYPVGTLKISRQRGSATMENL